MIFFCSASFSASRAPVTSAGAACENVEITRSVALDAVQAAALPPARRRR